MLASGGWVTVGIDNGGTANNGTVLDSDGRFLVTEMAELPSLVREGPDKAITALADSFDKVLAHDRGAEGEWCEPSALTRPARPARTASSPPAARRTSVTPTGPGSTSGLPLRSGSASRCSTTMTATRPPCTPTTCGTVPGPSRTAPFPPSSAPVSAAA